jgi:hypothetical protein
MSELRGGYLAPRATSSEHRLAVLVADPGQFDLFEAAMARVSQDMREALLRNDPAVDPLLEKMMEGLARHFFLAARMRAYGAKSLREFLLSCSASTPSRVWVREDRVLHTGVRQRGRCHSRWAGQTALGGPRAPEGLRAIHGGGGRRRPLRGRRTSSTASSTTGWIRPWRRRHRTRSPAARTS